MPPVASGVDKLDGSSDVKIVPDGDSMYFCVNVDNSAGTNPRSH